MPTRRRFPTAAGPAAVWGAAVASALVFAPLAVLPLNVFLGMSDALFYVSVLRQVAEQMAAGDLRPVWLPGANHGTGSPAMLFYNPLAYQLSAVLGAPLAAHDPLGSARFVLGLFVAGWLGGVTTWAWLRRIVPPPAALAGSLLYTLFPYRLVYVYLHGNLAQVWALVFLPLLMMAAEDIAGARRRAWAWYALWLGLLALTHPRTLVAFAALPAVYALVLAEGPRWRVAASAVAARLVAAHAAGAALAAFYWLPAAMNLDLIRPEAANVGRFHYADNLNHVDLTLNLHYVLVVVLAVGLSQRVPALRAGHPAARVWTFVAAIALAAFLCLGVSRPVWDALPPLQFLQFPAARLHAVALVAATALAAIYLAHRAGPQVPRGLYSPVVLVLALLVATGFTLRHLHGIYTRATGLDGAYVRQAQAANPIPPQEYATRWQSAEQPVAFMFASPLPLVAVQRGPARAVARFVDARTLQFEASVDAPGATLRVRQLYLPQWQAAGLTMRPDAEGLITFDLPPGEHRPTLALAPFRFEVQARWISAGAALLLLAALLAPRRRHEKGGAIAPPSGA